MNIHADSNIKICGVYIYGIEPQKVDVIIPIPQSRQNTAVWSVMIISLIVVGVLLFILVKYAIHTNAKNIQFEQQKNKEMTPMKEGQNDTNTEIITIDNEHEKVNLVLNAT